MKAHIEDLFRNDKGGMRFHFWYKYIDDIGSLIQRHQIPKIETGHMKKFAQQKVPPGISREAYIEEREMLRAYWPGGIAGGMRIPHVHYKGDLYILKDEHWSELTENIMRRFKEKLESVNTISFDQMMDLSEVIDALPARLTVTKY